MQTKAFFRGILIGIVLTIIGLGIGFYVPDRSVEDLTAAYTYPTSDFIEVQGMDVHFRSEGEGPTLLLLHGTGASLHTWEGWTTALQDSFRVVSLDLPAFGLTGPHPDRDYTITAYVTFLEAFAKKAELDSFHLAGNSLGGLIAWSYALEHPERIEKLILVDPSGFPKIAEDPLAFKMAKNPILGGVLRYITPKRLFEESLRSAYGNPELVSDALVDQYYQLFRRPGNRAAFVDRARTEYPGSTQRLAELQMPCLIMWGEKDTWISPDRAADFQQSIAQSEVRMYPDLGHVPMEEAPVVTAGDVRTFLEK